MPTDLGKAVITPQGDYSAIVAYEKLDLVTYDGGSYIAKTATTGNLPTNATYWQVIALAGTTSDDIAIADDGEYFTGTNVEDVLQEVGAAIQPATFLASIRDMLWPVGSIYMSTASDNPSTFVGGTWVAWGAGKVPVGVDAADADFDTSEETGGAKTHTHTLVDGYAKFVGSTGAANVYCERKTSVTWANDFSTPVAGNSVDVDPPVSKFTATSLGGSTDSGSTLPPYIVCYMWKRTA